MLLIYLAEALIKLEQPEVVTEGEHAAVNVCVAIVTPNIECAIPFSFELFFSTEDVEAGKLQSCILQGTYQCWLWYVSSSESPGDYILKDEDKIVTFDACAKRVCTKVDIKDDCYVEDSETFKIKVEVVKSENVHNELSIRPSERLITIEDTDSMSLNRDITTDNQTSSSVYVCV